MATVLNLGLGYGFNLKIRVFMKIMHSLCPPSKKKVHIALCLSVGWSVYLDSRFPTTCETYNKDRLRLQLGILTVLKIFIVLQTREGGGSKVKIITDFVAAEGGMFTFTKISIVIFI